ncbi:MAG: efflux RND transporter periplasmic adaptor subunit [Acidobacteriaceae bacterium]
MRKRSFLIGFGTLALALVLCFGFVQLHGRSADASSSVATAPTAAVALVTRGNLASTLSVAGQFQPYQVVDVHAKVSGYIRKINVDIGDLVHNGQVLAVLEIPELTAQLEGTKASVRHSKSEISRTKQEVLQAEATHAALHADYARLEQASKARPGLIAQQELDDALAKDQSSEAQVSAAKSALEAAQQQLAVSTADSDRVQQLSDYEQITAPFTGVVTMRYADTGALIPAGTTNNTNAMPVVQVAQSDLLRLRLPVPEADVSFIHIGGEVQVKVQATGHVFTGKIVRFTRLLNTSTRTMLTEVDVPNPDLTLTPGMYCETLVQLQQKNNVVIVPVQGVVQGDGTPYALVVDENNRVQRRNVTLGIQGNNRLEVVSGLKPSDRVIVASQGSFQPGELVHPQVTATLYSTDDQGGN